MEQQVGVSLRSEDRIDRHEHRVLRQLGQSGAAGLPRARAADLRLDPLIGRVGRRVGDGRCAIARGLGWFVRDQVEFNRAILACVEAQLEASRETNRSFAILAASFSASSSRCGS